ncbi:MAG: hypothetical protein AAF251_08285 [Pseudomonadota bacterium]
MSMQQNTQPQTILPRSGKRPLSFNGELLVEGSDATNDDRMKYDLAVFEVRDSGFAASLSCTYQPDVEQPRYYAGLFDTVDDAVGFFADYSPADDVPLSPDANFADLAQADLAMKQATTSYHGLLKRMFPAAYATEEEDASCRA